MELPWVCAHLINPHVDNWELILMITMTFPIHKSQIKENQIFVSFKLSVHIICFWFDTQNTACGKLKITLHSYLSKQTYKYIYQFCCVKQDKA